MRERSQQLANWAVVASAPLAALLLLANYFALTQNAEAIDENREAIQAQTVYEIQKDARALQNKFLSDPRLYSALIERKSMSQLSDELRGSIDPILTQVMQFYSSVHVQHLGGHFPEEMWGAFYNEFCTFISIPFVNEHWNDRVINGSYNQEFIQSGNKCNV